jgi:hypothetical protein
LALRNHPAMHAFIATLSRIRGFGRRAALAKRRRSCSKALQMRDDIRIVAESRDRGDQ